MQFPFKIPLGVLTDSYKAGHNLMYPAADSMIAYGEFRQPYGKDKTDSRFIHYGIRYLVENYIAVKWTVEEVENIDKFFSTHNAGFTPYPFPKDLFLKFIAENDGYFPVTIQTLPEGTVAHTHVPVFQITAEKEYSRLVTFLETILTQLWYPSTVATLSRRVKEGIRGAFETSVDDEFYWLLDSKLHDFGFRGCTTVEQSILGGCSHLLNFTGTDTMSAAYYVQFHLNNGTPIATSIPATEHSVMTSWPTETDAINNMIDKFGGTGKLYSIVMDSYDYENALYNVLAEVREKQISTGGHLVLRPDSGNPVDAVLMGLDAAHKHFGAVKNKKGYWVLNNVSVLQGDGINADTVKDILQAVLDKGYSAQNVTFGMGGGLLQKVNRDAMSFATKLSCVVTSLDLLKKTTTEEQYTSNFERGYEKYGFLVRPVMKCPISDSGKISLPGKLRVVRDPSSPADLTIKPDFNVYPQHASDEAKQTNHNTDELPNEFITPYHMGPVKGFVWDDFTTVRNRVAAQWKASNPTFNPISAELQAEIDKWSAFIKRHHEEHSQ